MFCTKCGAELQEGVRFCSVCGAPVALIPKQDAMREEPEPIPEPEIPVPEPEPYVPVYDTYMAQPEPKRKKRSVWPIVILCLLLAVLIAVCVVLLVPGVHDMVFGVKPVTFIETETELALGDKRDLTDLLDAGDREDDAIVWSSDDEQIVTVKNGVVTAVGPGSCEITARDSERDTVSDSIRVTVYEKKLGFRSESLTIKAGEHEKLADGNLYSEHLDTSALRWTSSNESVASVNDSGVVTAISGGTTFITVEADGMKATVTITVEEEKPEATPSPTPTPTATPAPTPAPAPSGITDTESVQRELEQIRSWYYFPGIGNRRVEILPGMDGWEYGREYLYHDGEMVFAFIYNIHVQYRLYFKDSVLIHVIETNGNELDGDAMAPYLDLADQAKTDAAAHTP